MKKLMLSLLLLSALCSQSFGAVGCDLNDPDRDVKRFFPQSTGYKTAYMSVDKLGGETLLKEIEEKLGDNFSGLYETIDVPYTLYTIYQKDKIIGYIHGINQKGQYGGLQVFLVYLPDLTIEDFYCQKLTSKKAKELRSREFALQFNGLTFKDFENYDPKTAQGGSDKVKALKNPNPQDDADFKAILRAVKKNLILTKIFINAKEAK
ncbi:MAG: hypothetical protein LBQ47_03385 [Endomicrobium sp.]|jgi:hypothetical protein|nr:hypothetical protein [Endomicrobium sp.]